MPLHQAPDIDAPAPALLTEGMVLLAIDTETGGLDPARHAITQIGFVGLIWREGLLPIRSVFPLSFAVNIVPNPRMDVTDEALRVQGHTRESLAARTDAVPEREAVRLLAGALANYPGAPLLAHNAKFDAGFLTELARRTGTPIPTPRPLICTKERQSLLQRDGTVPLAAQPQRTRCALGNGRRRDGPNKSISVCRWLRSPAVIAGRCFGRSGWGIGSALLPASTKTSGRAGSNLTRNWRRRELRRELPDMNTTDVTMPIHTTIDHLDDALQRLAKAEGHCAAMEAKYLRMADDRARENERLRSRIRELTEALQSVYEVIVDVDDPAMDGQITEAIITAEAALDGNDTILAMAMEAAEHDRS